MPGLALPLFQRWRALVLTAGVALVTACSRGSAPQPVGKTSASGPPSSTGIHGAAPRGRCLFADASSKYTVLFTASVPHVQAIFAGWRKPVAPWTKVHRSSLTGQETSFQTTEPSAGDGGATARAWDLRPDDITQTGYEGYLESRIPPEIRSLPHRSMKRILFETMALAEAISGKPDLPEVLFPPHECTTSLPLLRVPDPVVAALQGMSDEGATALAARLVEGEAFSGWPTAELTAFLADLRTLARTAARDEGVYLLPV